MKKESSRGLALASAAVVAIALAVSLKRVPPGSEALLVSGGGRPVAYGPGWHLVRPFSGAFSVYPVGEVALRFPREGSAPVLLKDGSQTEVVLSFRLDIPEGSAENLYGIVGKEFAAGIEEVFRDAVEIRAAAWSPAAEGETPEAFALAVAEDLRETLSGARVAVLSAEIESWGGAARGKRGGRLRGANKKNRLYRRRRRRLGNH